MLIIKRTKLWQRVPSLAFSENPIAATFWTLCRNNYMLSLICSHSRAQGHHYFSPKSVIKKTKTNWAIEHVSMERDIINDWTRFRGSEYLVWLLIWQWIGSPSVDKSAIWFGFLITYFRRYLERSGGVLAWEEVIDRKNNWIRWHQVAFSERVLLRWMGNLLFVFL